MSRLVSAQRREQGGRRTASRCVRRVGAYVTDVPESVGQLGAHSEVPGPEGKSEHLGWELGRRERRLRSLRNPGEACRGVHRDEDY